MPTSAQTHAEPELAAQLEAARTAAGEALDAALLAFGQVQEQLATLAQERDALRADLATARRDLDLARGLIARLGDLDALESLATVNESLKARVAELEREVKLREMQTQRMMLARDAMQRERDAARARADTEAGPTAYPHREFEVSRPDDAPDRTARLVAAAREAADRLAEVSDYLGPFDAFGLITETLTKVRTALKEFE